MLCEVNQSQINVTGERKKNALGDQIDEQTDHQKHQAVLDCKFLRYDAFLHQLVSNRFGASKVRITIESHTYRIVRNNNYALNGLFATT